MLGFIAIFVGPSIQTVTSLVPSITRPSHPIIVFYTWLCVNYSIAGVKGRMSSHISLVLRPLGPSVNIWTVSNHIDISYILSIYSRYRPTCMAVAKSTMSAPIFAYM